MYELRQGKVTHRLIDKNSKQLKLFIDNRTKTKANSFISTIIQRASLEEWISNAQKDKNAPITLYTHILNDGFGDAGQLGYLVDKMNSLHLNRKIVPYATHEHESKDIPTIKELSRISDDKYLKKSKKRKAHWISECANSWEIQYPVPACNSKNENTQRILRIGEMGANFGSIKYLSDNYYHTGIGPGLINYSIPVGYGIPSFNITSDLYHEMLKMVGFDSNTLKDTWLVKVPNVNFIDKILTIAHQRGCGSIILLGVTEQDLKDKNVDLKKFTGMSINVIKFLPQKILTCLMYAIGGDNGKGMIFSAGEGMYVQALGASQAAVGNLIRNESYDYQLFQIAQDMLLLGTLTSALPMPELGMMEDLDQEKLRIHSNKVRMYNWFDQLNKLNPQVSSGRELPSRRAHPSV